MSKLYKPAGGDPHLDRLFRVMLNDLCKAPAVDTGHWQALRGVPQTKTQEILNVHFEMDIPPTPGSLAAFVKPNLPWAEAHFLERVGGQPLNPGVEYRNWPYFKGNVEQHQTEAQEAFSHTYMERIWPRNANRIGFADAHGVHPPGENAGIRYRYGDLDDVLRLLVKEPHTRQAFLPIWFPEDTGGHHGGRLPCTLGYHFMLRAERLHCFYPIRSCDAIRHFRDDVYLAARLCQWVIMKCKELAAERAGDIPGIKVLEAAPTAWDNVYPGTLTMFIPSLHVFEAEVPGLRKKLDREARAYAH